MEAMEALVEESCSASSGIDYRPPELNSVHIHTTRETIHQYDQQLLPSRVTTSILPRLLAFLVSPLS